MLAQQLFQRGFTQWVWEPAHMDNRRAFGSLSHRHGGERECGPGTRLAQEPGALSRQVDPGFAGYMTGTMNLFVSLNCAAEQSLASNVPLTYADTGPLQP